MFQQAAALGEAERTQSGSALLEKLAHTLALHFPYRIPVELSQIDRLMVSSPVPALQRLY
jgi:hypothetical protein